MQRSSILRVFPPLPLHRAEADIDAARAQREYLYPLWAVTLVAAVAAIDVVWLALTPLSLAPSGIPTLVIAAIAAQLVTRRPPLPGRANMLLAGMALILAAWPVLRLFNHLVMTTAFPLADEQLAAWDAMLGLDWLSYVEWVDRHPILLEAMAVAYQWLDIYSCAAFLLLLWLVGVDRAREFTLLFLITAVAATTIGMFFPAEAAMAHFAPPPDMFAALTAEAGTYHLTPLAQLRTDPGHVFTLNEMPGLTTFPSFHTAMGLVCIYSARGSRPLFIPMLALNGLMIASTPVFGSHYFVDILAGGLLTLGAIMLLRALRARSRGRAIEAAGG